MQATQPNRKILQVGRQPLGVFFAPKTVAVIGASETAFAVGRTVLWNLPNQRRSPK
jgi:acetyltransferase